MTVKSIKSGAPSDQSLVPEQIIDDAREGIVAEYLESGEFVRRVALVASDVKELMTEGAGPEEVEAAILQRADLLRYSRDLPSDAEDDDDDDEPAND